MEDLPCPTFDLHYQGYFVQYLYKVVNIKAKVGY